jgi:chromate transporter
VLFGSGYVLIAYIQQDLVDSFHWLTSQQLLDAIAIGQITPGPVSTAAGVVGYILAGVPGAVAATVGIFLPSFVLVILTAPLIPRMRDSQVMSAFLTGVNAGVVAAILVTLVDLAQAALRTPDGAAFSPVAIAAALGALGLLVRTRLNATGLIAAGGLVGLLAG